MADFDYDSLEDLTINLEMEDGENVECEVHTIFEYDGTDYIALIPADTDEDDEEVEVYFFGFEATGRGDNLDISLDVIEDDDLLNELSQAFSEIMEEAEEEEDDGEWDEFIHKKLDDLD